MVRVTIGALVAARYLDAGEVDTSGEDQVELMPVFGSRLSPGDSMLRLCVEEGVTDAQPMMTAERQQALAILLHFSSAELTQAGEPGVVIDTYSGVEIAGDEQ